MARISNQLLVSLCVFSAFLGVALAGPTSTFTIIGKVYCDTCRAGFETNITTFIEGAKVGVACRHYDSDKVEHKSEGVTGPEGVYKVQIEDDHEEEICEVALLSSPLEDCNEVENGRDRARVLLTRNSGMSEDVRFANALGYLKKDALPECPDILKQYTLDDEENI